MTKSKIVYSKTNKCWCLVDTTGYPVFFHDKPSVVRKAKLYWFCYLTAKTDAADEYLEKMSKLND